MASDGDGLLLVDKSAGHSSHDVVVALRRALGTRKVGHTGTLDPFATGLLLACVGRTTRLADYFHLPSKTYRAEVRLGVETTTHDIEGEEASISEGWRDVKSAQLRKAVADLTGELLQLPPAYSAKRVAGRRAYEVARAGGRPELVPVAVQVHELQILEFRPPDVRLEAVVSTGTYIRALVRDLGRTLGCGAHLRALRRTRIGPFSVDEALPDAELHRLADRESMEDMWWRSSAEALAWLPRRELEESEAYRVREGRRIPIGELHSPVLLETGNGEPVRSPRTVVLLRNDDLVAVAEVVGAELQPRKVVADC